MLNHSHNLIIYYQKNEYLILNSNYNKTINEYHIRENIEVEIEKIVKLYW
jgi:hypothetical protein